MRTVRIASAVFPPFASVHFAYWLAWAGSLALSVTLIVLLWTRWGQSRPLHKCAALSLLVHLVLAFLTMTVRIVAGDGGGGGGGGGPPIHVRIVEDGESLTKVASSASDNARDLAPPALLEPPAKKDEPPTPPIVPPELAAKRDEPRPVVEQPAHEPMKTIVETNAPQPAPQSVAVKSKPASGAAAQQSSTHVKTVQSSPANSEAVPVGNPYALRRRFRPA